MTSIEITKGLTKELSDCLSKLIAKTSSNEKLFSTNVNNIKVGKYYVIYNAYNECWIQYVKEKRTYDLYCDYLWFNLGKSAVVLIDTYSDFHGKHRLATNKEIRLFEKIVKFCRK